jgi:glycosyltransferase involved in cell wall biosynthesis
MSFASPAVTDDLSECRILALLNGTNLYGQEKGNIQVLRVMQECGAKVMFGVSTIEDGGDVKQYLRQLGQSVVQFPFGCQWSKKQFLRQPSWIGTNVLGLWRCSRLMSKQVSSFRPTHVHLGNPLVYSFIAPYLSINRRIRLVYRMGDVPPHNSIPNLAIWRSCIRRADAVIANSGFVRESILRAAPRSTPKVRLIYNLSVVGKESTESGQRAVSADSEKGEIKLLFVGQLSPNKGVDDLIEAVARLLGRSARIRLDIVGAAPYDGDYRRRLEKSVIDGGLARSIRFHGYQSDPKPFYENADLLILPSRLFEAAANVVLEAKSCGVPSVVYPTGGLPELVLHGQNGFVCRERSVDALVEGIQFYLDDPLRVATHSQSAINDDAARFGRERFCQQWKEIYLGRPSGPLT